MPPLELVEPPLDPEELALELDALLVLALVLLEVEVLPPKLLELLLPELPEELLDEAEEADELLDEPEEPDEPLLPPCGGFHGWWSLPPLEDEEELPELALELDDALLLELAELAELELPPLEVELPPVDVLVEAVKKLPLLLPPPKKPPLKKPPPKPPP